MHFFILIHIRGTIIICSVYFSVYLYALFVLLWQFENSSCSLSKGSPSDNKDSNTT